MPNGVLLNQCVCDGLERPFCEVVKQNMAKLCAIGDHSIIDHDGTDDLYEDEDYEGKPDSEVTDSDAVSISSVLTYTPQVVLLCTAFALGGL